MKFPKFPKVKSSGIASLFSYRELQKTLKSYRDKGFHTPPLNSKKEILEEAVYAFECHEVRKEISWYKQHGSFPGIPNVDAEYMDQVRFLCKVDRSFAAKRLAKAIAA